ncbi:hypothetical protein [Archaeoglobus sp.]
MVLKLRRRDKRKKYDVLREIRKSPYLGMLLARLCSLQKENGSWFDDPLITAYALRALHKSSVIFSERDEIGDVIRRGRQYLEKELESLVDKVIATRRLYSQLDTLARTFSLLVLVLSEINKKSKFDELTLTAFKKIEEEVVKYRYSLGDLEVFSQFVKCHSIKSFGEPPVELVEFLLDKLLSSEEPSVKLEILDSLYSITKDHGKLLETSWRKISARYGIQQDLSEYFNKTAVNTLRSLVESESSEIKALYYGNSLMEKLNVHLPEVWSLTLKKAENLLSRMYSENDEHFLYEFSLAAESLCLTPFRNAMVLNAENLEEIEKAIRWYEENKSKNLVLLSKKRYLLMEVALVAVILLTILLAVYIIYGFNVWFVLSVLVSLVLFIFSRISK